MITSIGISSKLVFLFVYCSIPKFLIDSVDLHQLLAAPFFMAKLTGKADFPVILKNKNDRDFLDAGQGYVGWISV